MFTNRACGRVAQRATSQRYPLTELLLLLQATERLHWESNRASRCRRPNSVFIVVTAAAVVVVVDCHAA
jgi:hypothetical protein